MRWRAPACRSERTHTWATSTPTRDGLRRRCSRRRNTQGARPPGSRAALGSSVDAAGPVPRTSPRSPASRRSGTTLCTSIGRASPDLPDGVDLDPMARFALALAALSAAGGSVLLDRDALLREREATLASFRDPHASPLAAVARHDFAGDRPMTFGSAPGSDVPLEGVPARAAVVRALPDGFEMEREGKIERLAPGEKGPLGRYTLRL